MEVFDGPLDLLLVLVRRGGLEISCVALAQVTDQFLSYLSRLEAIDPSAIAAFCEEASTLMVIKSRTLLPRPPQVEPDEDADALALVERLRAYRQFKQVATGLGRREQGGLRAYARVAPLPDLPPKLDPGDVSAADLAAAFRAALAEADRQAAAEPPLGPPVPAPRLRLADRLVEIRSMLGERGRVTFREVLLGGRTDREYIIVSFLAVLELLRRAVIRAVQSDLFGEIVVELRPEAAAALAGGVAGTEPQDEGLFVDE
jgi:segregation and condensation protein A